MRLASTVKIEGDWAEYIPDSLGPSPHQYSFGRIYFDKRRKIYACDGTNYLNDGQKFCHWTTITSHIDAAQRRFFYTFAAQMERELGVTYYGFGVINLQSERDGSLVPSDGHYVSANVDGKPMSHSMIRVTTMKYSRRTSGTKVVALLEKRNGM